MGAFIAGCAFTLAGLVLAVGHRIEWWWREEHRPVSGSDVLLTGAGLLLIFVAILCFQVATATMG